MRYTCTVLCRSLSLSFVNRRNQLNLLGIPYAGSKLGTNWHDFCANWHDFCESLV
jgi:hypothetical protein